MSTQDIQAAGSNRHFSHSMTVNAPASRVWSVWMDVSHWPTWDTELLAASASAPLALGVTGMVKPKRGPRSHFKVVAYETGSRYAFDTPLIGATLHVARSLQQKGSATTFTHEVWFSGLAGGLFARLLGPGFRKALPQVMARIAEQAAVAR